MHHRTNATLRYATLTLTLTRYVMAAYSLNGTYLGLRELGDELQLCSGKAEDPTAFLQFGVGLEASARWLEPFAQPDPRLSLDLTLGRAPKPTPKDKAKPNLYPNRSPHPNPDPKPRPQTQTPNPDPKPRPYPYPKPPSRSSARSSSARCSP